MNKWFLISGLLLIVIAGVLASPLMNYLPIDLWLMIERILNNDSENVYFKIIPSKEEAIKTHIYLIIGIGIILILLGKFSKQKSKDNEW